MNRAGLLASLLALSVLTGCAQGIHPDESAEPEAVFPVYTDWSKLTPYQSPKPDPLYSRFAPYQGDALTPRSDYGVLLPYLGAELSVSNYLTDSLPVYGLVTMDGQIVTEPVYADVHPSSRYVENRPLIAPFLILLKGDPSCKNANGMMSQAGDFLCTVAAPDGRWVRDFGIAGAEYAGDDRLAVIEPDNSVTVLNRDGETAAYFPGDAFAPYLADSEAPYFKMDGGPNLSFKDGVFYVEGLDPKLNDVRIFCYLNLANGTVSPDPPEGFSDQWPEWTGSNSDGEGHSPVTDSVTGELYYFSRDNSPSSSSEPNLHILDAEKHTLLSVYDEGLMFYEPLIWNGLCAAVQNGAFCYYDLKSGACVFRFPLRSNLG